ncbi:right-handed parallel beta-helix repeat-containing protein [Rhizohabitans arisaemae]|uniref:right-handed parallel beta-helix repeat-containing protein n=1 Tax=Rhizohabitans arisaemae TaxID=2720610 RepID=UPI0024B2649B|nr:right-handed parallel beta-helix repeat-containing protein [Rhizohabitans arisaemae]
MQGTPTPRLDGTIFNVAEFTASGDGAGDDAAPIQRALDAAAAAGRGVVVIPPGTYRLRTNLVVRSNTVISAYGAHLIRAGGPLLRNFASGDAFPRHGGNSHIAVLGGIWDSAAADAPADARYNTLSFIHCTDVTVRDVTVRDVCSAHGVEFNAVDGGTVADCRFEGFRDASTGGRRRFSEAIQLDVTVSGSSTIGAFDGTPCRNILIHGCHSGPSATLGPFGKLVGSHTVAPEAYYEDIRVIGCTVDGALDDGIRGYGWRRAVISGNLVTGAAGRGIAVDVPAGSPRLTPDSVVISGNVVGKTGRQGIVVAGAAQAAVFGVRITGNTVNGTGAGFAGVWLSGCTGAAVVGNDVKGAGQSGIYTELGDATVISGNTVRNSASNGVNVTKQPGVLVQGNVVDTTAANHGVFLTESADSSVVGNHITAAASAGIRLGEGVVRCLVSANKIRKGGGTTRNGVSVVSPATVANHSTVVGNDLSGNDWSPAVSVTGRCNVVYPTHPVAGNNFL